ncbi:phage tail tube protein [Xylophilus ampelinus]|uniref:Tail tube protein n=1 Tax=Xylophilus ampelinus TaxID=54067 RepID=A0A318SQ70_9BURK|nr:phage tail tube protein [Xylophilus ampelinus]MCS4508890.1 phage tail protein [Xylophilus ampelinus]PYE79459.1 tail tube protein [Xylophilus ampelinus]
MADPIFWTNVGVDVQTALSPSIALSAVSKAAVGEATYTGSVNPAAGDYIVMSSQGMNEIDARVFRITGLDTATKKFLLDSEDTRDYQTFIGGSFQIITFGASMRTAQTIDTSGGDPEYTDVTTIHDQVRKRAPTVVSPMSMSMTNLFDLSDPAFIELNKAHKSKTKRAIRLRFGTGARMLLTGYASAAGVPTGQAQGVVQTKISIEAQNLPTVLSS